MSDEGVAWSAGAGSLGQLAGHQTTPDPDSGYPFPAEIKRHQGCRLVIVERSERVWKIRGGRFLG